MKLSRTNILLLFLAVVLVSTPAIGQLSPGDLAEKHAKYEGVSNCTQCHSIGNGVPDEKCLSCHKDIDQLRSSPKGYHSSSEARGKKCIACHSDHHGRDFDLTKFNEKTFDHRLAGYALEGAHTKLECRKCHKPAFIRNPETAKKEGTFLGLSTQCIHCHTDPHQGTLKEKCTNCHNQQKFKPAALFNHNNARFRLAGAHQTVQCSECHKITQKNGKEFQPFNNLTFSGCASCHNDVHEGRFGSNCTKCHSETSFKSLRQTAQFNHAITRFPLVGMHATVNCASCHKSNAKSKKLNFTACSNCHADYHKGEFKPKYPESDCKDCHSVNQKFSYTGFDVTRHNTGKFPLRGAHVAIPCISCHRTNADWKFNIPGNACVDCHSDPHQDKMNRKYLENNSCRNCHNEQGWNQVAFDHQQTGYKLEGRHEQSTCRECHYPNRDEYGKPLQQFNTLTKNCDHCHKNIHGNQFAMNNKTDCTRCHSTALAWKANLFDHNKTKFPLEGKHLQAPCSACHRGNPEITPGSIIEYKTNKLKCIDCHS